MERAIAELEEIGLNCSQHSYLPHFAPLVACEIQGRNSSAGTVVVGAHFDSRGSFGFPTAPGADDGSCLLPSSLEAMLMRKARWIRHRFTTHYRSTHHQIPPHFREESHHLLLLRRGAGIAWIELVCEASEGEGRGCRFDDTGRYGWV